MKQAIRQIVRNGYLSAREIQTGIGPVKVKVPKIRDKRAGNKVQLNIVAALFEKKEGYRRGPAMALLERDFYG